MTTEQQEAYDERYAICIAQPDIDHDTAHHEAMRSALAVVGEVLQVTQQLPLIE